MRRLLRMVTRVAVFAIATLIVAAAALIFSMRLPPAQRHLGEIITALAQRPGRFFVRVGNVRGTPPWNVQVDRVEIGDADGVWMVIEDAEADWHPFDIWKPFDDTHLRINVDRVHARRLSWTRLPIKDDEPDDKPFRWDRFPRIIAGENQTPIGDEQSGRLLTAPIAPGRLARREGSEKPLGKRELVAQLERARERVDGRRRDEDVPLGGVPGAGAPAGPLEAAGARERRGPTRGVDHAELALLAGPVGTCQASDDLGGGEPLAKQREPVRPVGDPRSRLRRDRPDAGFGPRDEGTNGEKPRRHRDPPLAPGEVAADDRERGRPQSSIVWPGATSRISTPGASDRSVSGVPVRAGKVPKWQGRQRATPSSSSAAAASRGPIV